MPTVHIANWSERHYTRNRFILWFGAYATTRVMVFSDHLEDAIEIAAKWLSENAPGHLMPLGGEELGSLMKEACEEWGLPYPQPKDPDFNDDGRLDDAYDDAEQAAVDDLTYTESGYLSSYEWGIVCENPTHKEVIELSKGRW